MDEITQQLKQHYAKTFSEHGMSALGVDWNDEKELQLRYEKMLKVMDMDFYPKLERTPTLLDVGCGWGGLYAHMQAHHIVADYTGIDVVPEMIDSARQAYPNAGFIHDDVFTMASEQRYDFVICNAILTQKLDVSIPAMERFSRELIQRMYDLCSHGIAFNMMSTRVNFMVDNLYYQNPTELFSWLLTELSPRVRFDHGYSSLNNGRGKYYDFTVYVYKD